MKIYKDITKLIGKTPLVQINKLNTNKNVTVLAKLESFNPTGSIKERIALSMIEDAERKGLLKKDMILLEATSGNTGIGLAMVAAVKGYKSLFVMSHKASVERRKLLKAYGAEIMIVQGDRGTDDAIEKAYELAREEPDKYHLVDQYNNEANWKAHYKTTAKEIWEDTEGTVTHFVASIGTTGTIVGTAKKLKEYNENVKIIAIEPNLGHTIQGLKSLKEAYKPGIWDKSNIDEKAPIEDEDAYEMARQLAKEEGILTGMSGGANMFVALQKAKELKEGVIVVIIPDTGERYLSTKLFKYEEDENGN